MALEAVSGEIAFLKHGDFCSEPFEFTSAARMPGNLHYPSGVREADCSADKAFYVERLAAFSPAGAAQEVGDCRHHVETLH